MTHDAILERIKHTIDTEPDITRAMERAVHLLRTQLEDYTWAGVYLMEGSDLVLGPYAGKPSPHTRIPPGRGICGAAATERATIVVDDVHADARYLACSIDTRSEIVTPIVHDGRVLGEIDVDSDRHAAFGQADRDLLESVATLLAPRLASR